LCSSELHIFGDFISFFYSQLTFHPPLFLVLLFILERGAQLNKLEEAVTGMVNDDDFILW
jgi:hypothetical protein